MVGLSCPIDEGFRPGGEHLRRCGGGRVRLVAVIGGHQQQEQVAISSLTQAVVDC